ncbi:MAG: modification methylase [Bacteroidetes bacterium]|nr:MAG: modification methylase [Bacteroidota bacterium]
MGGRTGAKPFVKWAGGKGQLLATLGGMLPEELLAGRPFSYLEPFVGGGAMLFYLLQRFPNIEHAVINDVNPTLTGTYRVIKERHEELAEELAELSGRYFSLADHEARRELFLSIRAAYNTEGLDELMRAKYFIFLNKTCFNGLYRVNAKGLFNVPFGRYKAPKICDRETLAQDSALLQRVEILTGDFTQMLRYAGEYTFAYYDPPYRPLDATSSFTSYTKEMFDDADQLRLKEHFDAMHAEGCLLMLSNSDGRGRNAENSFLDDLYAAYSIDHVQAIRALNSNPQKRGKLTEIVVRNY